MPCFALNYILTNKFLNKQMEELYRRALPPKKLNKKLRCLGLFGLSQKRGSAPSYGLVTSCRRPAENSPNTYNVSH